MARPVRPGLVLAICCMSLSDGLDGRHDRERRAAGDPPRPRRADLGAAVGDRRLHARRREPADAVGLARGSLRPPADVPDRADAVHARLGAVQHRAERWTRCRVSHAAGGRREHDEPGRDVDHHEHVRRAEGARTRDRHVGRGRRHLDGAGPAGRRRADADRRLARDLLDQRADRRSPRSCSRSASSPNRKAPRARRLDPLGAGARARGARRR